MERGRGIDIASVLRWKSKVEGGGGGSLGDVAPVGSTKVRHEKKE